MQLRERQISCHGNEGLNLCIHLSSSKWIAAAFEEYPPGSGNLLVALEPDRQWGKAIVLKTIEKYQEDGCLWNFFNPAQGVISVGISESSKIDGWDLELLKKRLGFD